MNVPRLVTAYYSDVPDPSIPGQRVSFGTSGHRGSSFKQAFNEWHILAITQAICLYRTRQNIAGPMFLGIDTHALSVPACATALEVLAANGVEVMLERWQAGTEEPPHFHPGDDMTVVVEGKMSVQFYRKEARSLVRDGERIFLEKGDVGYIRAGRVHEAKYIDACQLVYVHDGAFAFHLADAKVG